MKLDVLLAASAATILPPLVVIVSLLGALVVTDIVAAKPLAIAV